MKARITAIGTYTPEQVLTNDDLEKLVDTNDEWIVQRTGIRERRLSAPAEYTSDLSFQAIENLMTRFKKTVLDVDMILVATSTPDYPFPSVASQIQEKFHIQSAGAMDFNATCAGFTYGLHLANALITSGLHQKVLLVAAESLTKVTDYTDRSTCILFGDGAGAVLIEGNHDHSSFLSYHLGSEGKGGIHIYRSGLSSRMNEIDLIANQKIVQNGREVYKWAVNTVIQGMMEVMNKSHLELDQVDWFIPHSANLRIIDSICEKVQFPLTKTLYSMEYYGNTSAASIPLALDMGLQEGKITKGQHLLLYGFGSGLVHAGLLIQWDAIEITN